MGVWARNRCPTQAHLKSHNQALMILVWVNDMRKDVGQLDCFHRQARPDRWRMAGQIVNIHKAICQGVLLIAGHCKPRRSGQGLENKLGKLDEFTWCVQKTRIRNIERKACLRQFQGRTSPLAPAPGEPDCHELNQTQRRCGVR